VLLRWSICLRSLCTFWAHDGTRNMPSPGWMPPNVPAHVLKMAPMTRLMVVGQRASSAVQLQMPRLVCHSGWNIEFMVDRFRGRFGAAAVGFRRHLPPPAPPVLSHALGRSAELTRVSVRDICGRSGWYRVAEPVRNGCSKGLLWIATGCGFTDGG
jgi:hypothetical protein